LANIFQINDLTISCNAWAGDEMAIPDLIMEDTPDERGWTDTEEGSDSMTFFSGVISFLKQNGLSLWQSE
jgi:hypothetical protein